MTLADKKAKILSRIAELRELEGKATAGPWLREGGTIYSLEHYGWAKGKEIFHNRFATHVYAGRDCPLGEAEANAELLHAARNQFRLSLDIQEAFVRQAAFKHDWNMVTDLLNNKKGESKP